MPTTGAFWETQEPMMPWFFILLFQLCEVLVTLIYLNDTFAQENLQRSPFLILTTGIGTSNYSEKHGSDSWKNLFKTEFEIPLR